MRKGAVESFVLHTAGVGLLFIMHTALARLLGPQGYGVWAYALSIAAILGIVVPLGWPPALIRFIGQYKEERNWGLLRGAILRAHQTTLVSSLIVAAGLISAPVLVEMSADMALSFRFAALLTPIASFVRLRRRALQAVERIKASICFEEIILPLLITCSCLILGVSAPSTALWIHVTVGCGVFLMATVWLWQALPEEVRHTKAQFETRQWLGISVPMMFGGVSQLILDRSSTVILGLFSDMASVGIFNAAFRISALNLLVLGAVNTIAAPMFGASFHGGRKDEFNYVMKKGMLWSTIGSLPFFASMMLIPHHLLNLFGSEFIEGKNILRILAVGQLVAAAVGPVGYNLIMSGKEKAFALVWTVVATSSVLGNFLLIPFFGAYGAAIVTAGSVTSLSIWQLVLTRERKLR